MTDDVSRFDGITRLDLPTDRVLEAAEGHCTGGVVVIGIDDDGEFYFASSIGDDAQTLWLIEHAKKRLMEIEP